MKKDVAYSPLWSLFLITPGSVMFTIGSSVALEIVPALFNQGKIVYVVGEDTEDISKALITELGQVATFGKRKIY